MIEAKFKKHLDAAEKNPKLIAAAVSGLPEKVLRYKPAPDRWCILEVLAHLADIEIVYAYRIRQMLADKEPVIAPMDQNDWARNLNYLDVPTPELIAVYGLNRHHTLRLLRSYSPLISRRAHTILTSSANLVWQSRWRESRPTAQITWHKSSG